MTRKQKRQQALERQIARLDRRIEDLAQISNQYTWARLLSFFGGALASVILLFAAGWTASGIAVIVWVGGFGTVARIHRRIQHSLTSHRIWREIKQTHLARMTVAWQVLPPAPSTAAQPLHPFESDLDLIGDRSLLRLIDTSVSQGGYDRLRGWLTANEP
ncbi:MAG: hypothetical protein GYB65_00085, partial [Chloroflexi bacterium]|nr:hypothetical protein [Chloroflexota bacterium]